MSSIIKHDRVHLGDGDGVPAALPRAGGKPGARCKKSVQLLREKDVVHAVEVRCSCGELTVIELDYAPREGQVNP